MAQVERRVNYLHYGDALEELARKRIICANVVTTKQDVVRRLESDGCLSRHALEVIQSYKSPYKYEMDTREFFRDISLSSMRRTTFRQLQCRGFSFEVHTNIEFSYRLRPSVNFRMALVTAPDLFYPRRLRLYLPRSIHWTYNHYRNGKHPAIAFALGRRIGAALYIFTLQSDLVHQGPAYVREHFRGWRRVLFNEILVEATRARIATIRLSRSSDVRKTYDTEIGCPSAIPRLRHYVYDDTAAFFKMRKVRIDKQLNIQPLCDFPLAYTREFYNLNRPERSLLSMNPGERGAKR